MQQKERKSTEKQLQEGSHGQRQNWEQLSVDQAGRIAEAEVVIIDGRGRSQLAVKERES